MQTGALIVAAGMSSRMGDFKPMLNIGSISIAQRIVATFQQAGITRIVMITGYNAITLERHLSNNGVIFLRNENYETTQMFDSARIGLEYLQDKCERILFTPLDIPLFTSDTVKALLASEAELACPVCDGQRGHPIMIASRLVGTILNDHGAGGLNGALSRCGTEMTEIGVEDAGILHDADTPEDYRALLQFHNQHLVRPVVSVALSKEKPFFDDKIAMLLTMVDETASVRTACQRMQISYSTGWNIIRTMESQFSRTLIERTQGGAGGGQSRLTDDGRELIARFHAYEEELRRKANELFGEYFDGVL